MHRLNLKNRALNAALACIALSVCGCKAKETATDQADTTASPAPYWIANPTLPVRPESFCSDATAIMQEQLSAADIRCKASPGTGYGIRGKRNGSEVVVLLGAGETWFAFAYLLDGKESSARISDEELNALARSFERAFAG